jgi:acyl-coenzyme A thioesterase PaaI-like protein
VDETTSGGKPTAAQFLAGKDDGSGGWIFTIGRERHGAFGGAFGGLLGACSVHAGRSLVPGRTPVAMDTRFLRGLPAGDARFVPQLIHEGRSLACVNVDVFDEEGRLTTRTLVSFVTPDALKNRDHPGAAGSGPGVKSWADGKPWRHPPGTTVPIIDTFSPRAIGRDERGDGVALPVPWGGPGHGAEAICMAADISVGGPVAGAFRDDPSPAPNPDLSVRILSDEVGSEVASFARLERIASGVALVRMEIWSNGALVGAGVCSSLLVG